MNELHHAIESGGLAAVKTLLKTGADPNEETGGGRTPLHSAALSERQDRAKIVDALLKAGADPDASDEDGWTPLHVAAGAEDGNPGSVKLLVAAGADLNAQDEPGRTPLHYAVLSKYGGTRVVSALLKLGSNPRAFDERGRTPLHYAVTRSPLAVVRRLLEEVGPNVKGGGNWTPLHLAAMAKSERRGIIKILVEKGAKVEARRIDGVTPLHLAAWHGHRKSVKALLDVGADLNAQDQDGWTPLHYAAVSGDPGTIKELLDAGAAADARDNDGKGKTPLFYTLRSAHGKQAVKALLDGGADLNARSGDGSTALLYAVGSELVKPEIIGDLLDAGADPSIANDDGVCPANLVENNPVLRGDPVYQRLISG